jgi:hypothetical protein
MQVVPLQAIPNQTLQVQLGNQACTLNIAQYQFGLFMTVYVGDTLIVASVICENFVRIIRSAYLGFVGDLAFFDTKGLSNPVYTGLGGSAAQYQLIYFTPEDLGES